MATKYLIETPYTLIEFGVKYAPPQSELHAVFLLIVKLLLTVVFWELFCLRLCLGAFLLTVVFGSFV